MKAIYLLFVLFLFSCSSKTKFSGIESDYTQELVGKIKKMIIKTYQYDVEQRDSILWVTTRSIDFDRKNRALKQTEHTLNFNYETVYRYGNASLKSTHSTTKDRTDRSEYVYDRKKNVIEYRQFQNDKLGFLKMSVYDSENNIVEETYLHPNAPHLNSVDKYSIDYINRIVTIRNFKENKPNDHRHLKLHYDEKGFLIRSETVHTGETESSSDLYIREYDAKGNLTKSTSYDKEKNIVSLTVSKNEYDSKGNILVRETFLNGKLFEKTVNEIVYW
ncbi:hypothetical protein ACI6PS_13440 [Flavobacterium sp. PLA-1-15]|uniref:hypothetical protein n=1 Tax=Flavobacterium sp. PLA-1-15 TaxID=3380533 RepID=UPI003B802C38